MCEFVEGEVEKENILQLEQFLKSNICPNQEMWT